jgi:inhibitor of cysteine peptidase
MLRGQSCGTGESAVLAGIGAVTEVHHCSMQEGKMMRRLSVWSIARIVLLSLVVLLFGCNSVKEIRIDESNEGEQIELAPGEILVVRLESNPSTGYQWEIEELDERVLRKIEAVFESAGGKDPPPGTGGWTNIRFETVGEGETTLRLIFHQPWTDQEPISSYTVQVVVR